jgi:hypothetical protein
MEPLILVAYEMANKIHPSQLGTHANGQKNQHAQQVQPTKHIQGQESPNNHHKSLKQTTFHVKKVYMIELDRQHSTHSISCTTRNI